MDLTDGQWAVLEPLIPKPYRRRDGKGRPWKNSRDVLNGVLRILRTGAPWHDMPERYLPYQTCHRRLQQWAKTGVIQQALKALAKDLRIRGGLALSECFIDGTFIAAKKGANVLERPSGARLRKSWQWQTVLVFLSPYAQQALRLTKSNSSKQSLTLDLSKQSQSD